MNTDHHLVSQFVRALRKLLAYRGVSWALRAALVAGGTALLVAGSALLLNGGSIGGQQAQTPADRTTATATESVARSAQTVPADVTSPAQTETAVPTEPAADPRPTSASVVTDPPELTPPPPQELSMPTPTAMPTATVAGMATSTAIPTPKALTPQPSPTTESDRLVVVVPMYNNRGLKIVRTALRPYIRPGDILVLVSGNNDRPLDVSWLNQSATSLKNDYPDNVIMAMTAGLANVSAAALGVTGPIEAIVYVYEPNFPNEPEFTWDFTATLASLAQATQIAHERGLRSVGKPTGRPILQAYLQDYGWDYGLLAQRADEMIVQTQTYCRKGADEFRKAIDKVITQYGQAGTTRRWFPQVTVDPNAPNGVPVTRAYDCTRIAASRGLPGVTMWWSPSYPEAAVEFLERLGR